MKYEKYNKDFLEIIYQTQKKLKLKDLIFKKTYNSLKKDICLKLNLDPIEKLQLSFATVTKLKKEMMENEYFKDKKYIIKNVTLSIITNNYVSFDFVFFDKEYKIEHYEDIYMKLDYCSILQWELPNNIKYIHEIYAIDNAEKFESCDCVFCTEIINNYGYCEHCQKEQPNFQIFLRGASYGGTILQFNNYIVYKDIGNRGEKIFEDKTSLLDYLYIRRTEWDII